MFKTRKQKFIMFFINAPLFLACIFCIFMLHRVHQVPDQYEYVRWQR